MITPSWVSGSWRSFFVCGSSVYSCHLFLISSASVRSILFLFFIEPIFAWNIPLVSHFLDGISSLSHSIVFLYFVAPITEEGFLISPCYSLELCIHMGISFLFSFAFHFFSELFVRPPQTIILPFCISFSWEWSWSLPPVQCHEPPSIVLQALCLSDIIPWICLSLLLYSCKGFYLGHTWMVYWFSLLSLSLNLAIRSSWSGPQSALSLVFFLTV